MSFVDWKKSAKADQGKEAEDEVSAVLKILGLRIDTAFFRLPDARAGSKQPTLSDYLMLHAGTMFLLEVKETLDKCRLPFGNFKVDQVARMRRFKYAGCRSKVLVYHKALAKWRVADIDHFIKREGGSWDMSGFPLQNLEDILSAGKDTSLPLTVADESVDSFILGPR